MQGKVIAIFGPDGSGKSTHIELLGSYLESSKIKIRRTWICSHHAFAWLLCRIFVVLGRYIPLPNKKHPLEKYPPPEVFKSRLGRRIWLLTEFVSLILTMLLRIYVPRLVGYTIIVERYIPGTLADLVYLFGDSFLNGFGTKLLLRLCNGASFVYLKTDYAAIFERRRNRAEPKDYIETQRRVYEWFSNNFNCSVVNSTSSIQRTQALIRKCLFEKSPVSNSLSSSDRQQFSCQGDG